MSWATNYIDKLKNGETVEFRPVGRSMGMHIQSGQLVQVSPVNREVKEGDIVLCKVGRAQYLHFVKKIKNGKYQIGNAHGYINGWITRDNIFGVVTWVEGQITDCT